VRIGRWTLVVAWLLLVGSLVRERISVGGGDPPERDASVAASGQGDRDDWMGLYMQGRKIGYTHHRLQKTPLGFEFSERSVLKIAVMGAAQTVRTASRGEMGADLSLQRFSISLDGGVASLAVRGEVEGNAVSLRLTTGGQKQEERFPLPGALYLPFSARSRLVATGLEPGRSLKVDVFDPSAMGSHPLELAVEGQALIDVGGEKVQAWLVRESFRGMGSRLWMDDTGTVLREEGPMGLVAVREDAVQALSGGWETEAAFDLTTAFAIPAGRQLDDARNLGHLAVRIGGLGHLRIAEDERQSYRGGVLHVVREDGADLGSYELPYAGERWREDLAATPFLQIDHPSVRGAVREALGDERDARRAAEKLRAWVFRSLDKVPTTSIPNAVQVLEMRSGDCNEHAVLLAALARAAGLPARVVAGAVYLDGVFLYHAWNEVWLGEGWVSVDAAMDQMPVDATHIELLSGGPEVHAELATLMGQLSIEVLPDQDPET
jgi:hypothetical protein